ncbi:asb013 [Agrotis segetum nucleopolyhedrovirus B]|uniref:Asb013 n=1 Tax=Agrotis segetum nucleopolyhedrovirus B TaxID=1580580 RepID=A0A0A7KT98_9ABAC|nr:asb013 [Agrotis segetum nucleopolyhedrovirus B]AIZ48571.1 asb013 [Agrotis segetum nucleopolyhedrovirus B]
MYYSSSPRYSYRGGGSSSAISGYQYDNIMRQHDTMRKDLRTLKSQVYEMCQQSVSDRSLCDRIRPTSSIDNTIYYPSSSRYFNNNSSSNIITTTTTNRNNNDNAKNVGTTVTVVDPIKY